MQSISCSLFSYSTGFRRRGNSGKAVEFLICFQVIQMHNPPLKIFFAHSTYLYQRKRLYLKIGNIWEYYTINIKGIVNVLIISISCLIRFFFVIKSQALLPVQLKRGWGISSIHSCFSLQSLYLRFLRVVEAYMPEISVTSFSNCLYLQPLFFIIFCIQNT